MKHIQKQIQNYLDEIKEQQQITPKIVNNR